MGAKHALTTTLALLCLTGWSFAGRAAENAPAANGYSGNSALGWQSGEQIFQSDGSRGYGAILTSRGNFPTPQGRRNASLVVNCAKGVLSVVFVWPNTIAMSVLQPQDVQWRFDNDSRETQSWMTLPNANASSSPSPRDFLVAMRRAHRLVVGTSDHVTGGKIEAAFDLDGGSTPLYRQVNVREVADRVTGNCPQ